jgi:hypothetical protein
MADDKPMMVGYLLKWTNYMKGFQRRYFILDRGILSYYRFAAHMYAYLTSTRAMFDPHTPTPRHLP